MVSPGTNIMNWKNGILLFAVSYALYLIIWLLLDDETSKQLPEMIWSDYLFDFSLCVLFTYISLGFCYLLFKFLPFRTSYLWTIIYASGLLIINNVVAFGMVSLFCLIWGDIDSNAVYNELINMKGAYTFAMIATFISSVYANSFYLKSYLKAQDEKQKLEIALIKEKETALQFQLNSLKLQINPHFLFNNFSTLSELIESDPETASDFLSHLSKVYRHIVRNLNVNLIDLRDELKFIDSYAYLMKLRHGEGIKVNIDNSLRTSSYKIPPASLQLLVENAIKHNAFSPEQPLIVDIRAEKDYLVVRNLKQPLENPAESTGVGQSNIASRYLLLSSKEIKIEDSDHFYSVGVPLL